MHIKSVLAVLAASVAVASAAPAAGFNAFAINALDVCPGTTGSLAVDDVMINPNPIIIGQNVTISASGKVTKEITAGAKAKVTVKAGFLTLYSSEVDICEAALENGIVCPIPIGDNAVTISQPVPSIVPKGTYQVKVDAKHADGSALVCFQGPVSAVRA
ncbi:Phosphatidylglycerol/phosphatidylinositol transfer protein [Gaertneriomyces sp. JEL0708]|nr:Phosphatidylglycerol/phosphatidylinositol transfer protein [Gaertneriomyces sp. JEL0708]